ncbi:carbohydrate porin [Acetobacteraceae bacterium]|nr:carbohydrate porin [Acetobacteraceae bacterium]
MKSEYKKRFGKACSCTANHHHTEDVSFAADAVVVLKGAVLCACLICSGRAATARAQTTLSPSPAYERKLGTESQDIEIKALLKQEMTTEMGMLHPSHSKKHYCSAHRNHQFERKLHAHFVLEDAPPSLEREEKEEESDKGSDFLTQNSLPLFGNHAMTSEEFWQNSMMQGSFPAVNNVGAVVASESMGDSQNLDSGDILHRDEMLGSLFGIRNLLGHFGVTFSVLDIEEVWGNPTGGTPSQADGSPVWGGNGHGSSQSAAYIGVTMLNLQADLTKILGPKLGLFNISGMQIRGQELSQDHLAVFNPVSGQEADRSFRLFEMWYQQPLFHNRMDIRVGQMDLDTEFWLSGYGGLYLNGNFGWPLLPSADLYSGGASWPLASPGVRFRYRPSSKVNFMFAASDDNPPGNQDNSFAIQDGGDSADPTNQDAGRSASGTKFNLGTGALLISELQVGMSFGKHHDLPGVWKLGGYYDTGAYPSYYQNQQGEPLGNPNDLGNPNIPAWKKGNWAVYGITDQMLWHSSTNANQSVGVFFEGMGTQGDRNLISFAANAGINFKAPFHNRPNDTLGLAWDIGVVSSGERHFDWESGAIMQTTENDMELTYQAMITPWLNLQPDFQYVFRPGGGAQDYAYNTLQRVGDEAILGLHADIKF